MRDLLCIGFNTYLMLVFTLFCKPIKNWNKNTLVYFTYCYQDNDIFIKDLDPYDII